MEYVNVSSPGSPMHQHSSERTTIFKAFNRLVYKYDNNGIKTWRLNDTLLSKSNFPGAAMYDIQVCSTSERGGCLVGPRQGRAEQLGWCGWNDKMGETPWLVSVDNNSSALGLCDEAIFYHLLLVECVSDAFCISGSKYQLIHYNYSMLKTRIQSLCVKRHDIHINSNLLGKLIILI